MNSLLFRIIFLSAFLISTLSASTIEISAKLIPRILFQSSIVSDKKTVNIAVVYTKNSLSKARELKNKIKPNYKEYSIDVTLVDAAKSPFKFDKYEGAYIFSNSNIDIDNLVKEAKSNSVLTFSDSYAQLKQGILFFIESKRKIVIHLNAESADRSNIGFNPTFLKYVKRYDGK